MGNIYQEDEVFEKKDYTLNPLAVGDYEACQFLNCNFSGVSLANIHFTDCIFSGCNMGMVKLNSTTLSDVLFKECKLLGLHFEDCNEFPFSVQFHSCTLNLSSFYKFKLKKTLFNNCSLQEVDLTEADLSNVVFENCDLAKALFENTILEKTDFRTAYNYSIDPERNRIKKARFSTAGIAGLLDKYDIEIS